MLKILNPKTRKYNRKIYMKGGNISTAVPIQMQKSNSIKGKQYICKSGTRRGKEHELEKEEKREDQKGKRTKKKLFL